MLQEEVISRIGTVAITLGLTSAQVLGLSATLQELHLDTEHGVTATVRIFQAMAAAPARFAKAAGLAVGEFTALVAANPYGALAKVSEGVARSSGSATTLAKLLHELALVGTSEVEVLTKLGNDTSLLREKAPPV